MPSFGPVNQGYREGHIPRFIPLELKRISHLDRYLSSIRLKTPLTRYPWGSHCVPHCLWPRVVSGSQYLLALLFFSAAVLFAVLFWTVTEQRVNVEYVWRNSSDDVLFRETKSVWAGGTTVHFTSRWLNITILNFVDIKWQNYEWWTNPNNVKYFCRGLMWSATRWHEGS